MLMPKRTKYRKQMRGRMRGKANRGAVVQFGDYGLQALEPAWITSRQIEACRRAMVRYIRRRGKVWIRIFPDKPVTQKPAETRMGKGKGSVEKWVCVVKARTYYVRDEQVCQKTDAREALRLAAHKLPIKTKFVKRFDPISGREVN